MKSSRQYALVRLAVLVAYIAMVLINVLANLLPLNGVTTGEISDSYRSLFTPAPYTFAIWGVIYLLLAFYVLYQLGFFGGDRSAVKPEVLRDIGVLFIISSIANIAWVLFWHYEWIPLTMAMMLLLLVCLTAIYRLLQKQNLKTSDRLFLALPFSVYLGWIIIATIANVAVLLIYLGWDRFGLSEPTWAVIVLIVAAVLGIFLVLKTRDIALAAVFVWAYIGILVKHISESGFAGQYPAVVATAAACLVLLCIALAYSLFPDKQRKRE